MIAIVAMLLFIAKQFLFNRMASLTWMYFLVLPLVAVSQQNFPFSNNPFRNNQNPNQNTFNPFSPPPTRDPSVFESVSPQRERDPFNPFNQFNNNNGPRRDFGGSFNQDSFTFNNVLNEEEKECPPGWDPFKESCYRFVRSPIHNREDARRYCQTYGDYAALISINNEEEHGWVVKRLLAIDPQHRLWYVSAKRSGPGSAWTNADGTQLVNLDAAFLPDQPSLSYVSNNFLAYSFSERRRMWGLLKVPGHDVHQYICEKPLAYVQNRISDNRDFSYGLELDDPKKIPRGPFFIQEPKSEVFDLSRNILRTYISLSCLAGGWPAPTYNWFREEYMNNTLVSILIEPLKDSKYTVSGGSLIIDTPTQKDDRGSYHCVATNHFGSIVSETVSISFGYIGEFILTRGTESGNQYWGKAIFCDPPQHFPSIHYYWSRKYFPNLVEEDQRVFVSYDGNLYISAVDVSDQGNYSCNVQSTVSNSGRNGPLFNLQVIPNANYQQLRYPNNFPKVFPEAPSRGGEVRLECVAFGYPVPSYNWTRVGSNLPRSAILSNHNRVLTIPNVTVEDQGDFSCRATNSRLSIESTVTLSIQAAPTFTIRLKDRHMDKNANLEWTCEAFGIPDVSYQWYRNGRLLNMEMLPPEDIGRYKIQDNVLTIQSLDEERDAGMYQCRANNSLAAKFSSAQLRVLTLHPSFKKKPLDSEILAADGGNVTIKCEPEAAPRPDFLWKKDGNLIGSGGRRRVMPNGNLLIYPVSREDQGIFTCVARNNVGVDESSGRLTVLRRPEWKDGISLPERMRYAVGDQLSLRCQADAEESLDIAYIWRHNDLRLDEVTSHRIRFDSKNGFLEIYNLTLADRGFYECEVNTWVGKLTSKTYIEIRGPPGPPGGVQARDFTSINATIIWTDGAMNGDEPRMYIVQGRTQWDPIWRTLVENITARDYDRLIGGRIGESGRKEADLIGVLSPWSAYEFRVAAANDYGYGPFSASSPQSNTLPYSPFISPRNVDGGGGKTGSLSISWDPLPPKDQNAPGVYYKVFWRRFKTDMEDEYQTTVLQEWGNIGSHVASIPSQYYFTKYEVRVQAWNDLGYGPISSPKTIYSAEDMPQAAPSLVTPRPFNSTAINVTWTPVDETREKMRGDLLGYRIRYWLKMGTNLYDPEAINYLSRSKEPHALIKGLIPNTYYYVQVMAYNSAGPGPASEPQFERTLKKAPQKPPTAVNVVALDPSTIRVTWRYVAPTVEEEALSGYKVRIWEADQDISRANDTRVLIGSKKLECEISNLEPGKSYILRVLAYSLGGDGKMSSPNQEFMLGDPQSLRGSGWHPAPVISHGIICLILWYLITYLN